eukprot:526911-Amphidinium_carterae.1
MAIRVPIMWNQRKVRPATDSKKNSEGGTGMTPPNIRKHCAKIKQIMQDFFPWGVPSGFFVHGLGVGIGRHASPTDNVPEQLCHAFGQLECCVSLCRFTSCSMGQTNPQWNEVPVVVCMRQG